MLQLTLFSMQDAESARAQHGSLSVSCCSSFWLFANANANPELRDDQLID